MAEIIFLNGKFISKEKARISVTEPGFLSGLGLFETMRAYHKHIVYLEAHLRRLRRSCRLIKMPLPYSLAQLKMWLRKAVGLSRCIDAYVRLTLWKSQKGSSISIMVKKYKPYPEAKYKKGFSACVSTFRQNEKSLLAQIKSISYILYQLAYQEAQVNGFDEAIMLNREGFITEGSRANIFLVKKGKIFTPALECGCLAGITRKAVMDLARGHCLKIIEKKLRIKDLERAEEAFLTNSLMGIMPLVRIEKRLIGRGKMGRLSEFFRERYKSLAFLSFIFCHLSLSSICAQNADREKAQNYAQQSEVLYQQAVGQYRQLIAQGKDLDELHFALGALYYQRGRYPQAIEEFKETTDPQAKKFLALAYYHLGSFTEALELFSRHQQPDDEEYLYYHGLTCEKLNLFDEALKIYRQIKGKEFSGLAKERVHLIEKGVNLRHIKDVDPKVSNILESAPQPEKYPQAGALILWCDERIEISAENTMVTSIHYIIKILNPRGKEAFSEIPVNYDSTFERVQLEYARTIKSDGQVVEVGARHIRDVSKYLNFPLYSNSRVYIISFPEVSDGACIEYKVKVYRSQLLNKKDFVLTYPLQTTEPIIQAFFSIGLPAEKTLFLKTINSEYNNFGANLNPRIQTQGNRRTYSWHFQGIPQLIPEANMPAQAKINPTLLVSTFSSWQEVYQWWWGLAKDKLQADNSIKQKVKELIAGLSNVEEKARAIYNFCAQQIRYVAVEYGQAGHQPHYATNIFKNKYGDCKDQAILLITMLKEAGFRAYPVLIPTRECPNLNPDFPSVIFDHCIAAVSLEEEIIFLDPTCETCSFGDLPVGDYGRRVLLFREDGFSIEETALSAAAHNLLKQEISLRLKPDESIAAEKSIFTSGFYEQAQRFWLLYTQPELIQQQLQERIQEISIGAKLDQYHIENLKDLNKRVRLTYAFWGPEYLTNAGNLRIMPQLAGLDSSLVAKEERQYPIDFNALELKETLIEVELPRGFVVEYLPSGITEESRWLNFQVEYQQKENKLFFKERLELKKDIIYPQEYLEFKRFFAEVAKKIKQRIVLKKITDEERT